MNIGNAMKTIREECGYSRRELASMMDCTQTALWKIECGKVQPKMLTLIFFCFKTKTPIARLYSLAMERKDYAPIPSIQDVVDSLRGQPGFSDDEIENIARRLVANRRY